MPQVKLWNTNVHDLRDHWRGKEIFIKAGEHVIMDYEDAKNYRRAHKSIMKTVDGAHDPRGFKKLDIEIIGEESKKEVSLKSEHKCQACGYDALSKWDLEGHVNELHVETMADEKEVKKRQAQKKGK